MITEYDYKFPPYAKLCNDGSIMVRTYVDKFKARYYRPCGEWGCTIVDENYIMKASEFPEWNIELISCSAEEFLKDNPYCVSENTARYFSNAIIELSNAGKIDANNSKAYLDAPDDGRPAYWMHKVVYKEFKPKSINYNNFEV